MKRFFSKRLLGIPMGIVAVILVATIALAAWGITNLISTGEIVVEPTIVESYEVDTNVLAFGTTYVTEGDPIEVTSQDITVTNTGTVGINGVEVLCSDVPPGLTAAPSDPGAIAPAGTGVVTVTLTGTAPAFPATIDLSVITATLQPY